MKFDEYTYTLDCIMEFKNWDFYIDLSYPRDKNYILFQN